MEYVPLGRAGVRVSRLCVGTMNFGPRATEAESFAILDRALELGLNFIDTADMYGRHKGAGLTEQIIGRWLAQGGRRDRVVLATKVYAEMGDGPNDARLSAYHIRRACEASLRRLGTDHIDLYQMHHVDLATPWAEIWQALEQLLREGKVTYFGSSNFAGWHIAQGQERAEARDLLGLVSEQSLYNLKDRTIELEVIPACRDYGLGLLPYSPLAGGFLAGPGPDEGALSRRQSSPKVKAATERFGDRRDAYLALCSEIGQDPAVVALAWLLHNPVVTAPIIGPRTLAQLERALPALSLILPTEVLNRLDSIWPGPGGPAPQAYAW
ncbi:MAG TPA: aldo/keto reductase [Anaerolineales bacterium]|nr:aldo/keto reductase [Anaerolineales bacterium]